MPIASQGLLLVYAEPGSPSPFTHDDSDTDDAPIPDFETWHDSTHVPALLTIPRSGQQPLFLACTRWAAADARAPSQLCLYDLAHPSAVYDSAYLALIGRTPSPRPTPAVPASADATPDLPSTSSISTSADADGYPEHELEPEQDEHEYEYEYEEEEPALEALRADARAVLGHMRLVERRAYEPLTHVCAPTLTAPSSGPDGWPDLDGERGLRRLGPWHGRYMSVAEVEMTKKHAEAEFNRWFDEEHVPLLMQVPGWVRSRRFALRAPLGAAGVGVADGDEKTGGGDEERGETEGDRERARVARRKRRRAQRKERPPKYLVVHEWTSIEVFGSVEFKRATSTPWRAHVLREEKVSRYEIRVFRLAGNWIGYEESTRFS